ncbi:hypothetical protein ACT3SP_12020 [Brachybacterium sp. AOP43-C2-M15]|uniref:hypothetical protein n=1 Tax=Brachybacterium sp. AOP43-C2-M15 TaxID=3457661 RepID=UPI0040345663
MRRLGLRRRQDGTTHIRPGGALVLCALVWVLCGATTLQAFWLLGADGWRFAVLPAVVSAVIWVVLWAPRVIVREDLIEVRNVLVTHLLPMGAIAHPRLGAMLRFDLVPAAHEETTAVVTAWNAPGVGRDRPRDRLSRSDPRSAHGSPTARENWAERLRRDQLTSPSHVAVAAWERWTAQDAQTRGRAGPAAEGLRPGETDAPSAERRLNRFTLGLLTACVLAVLVRGLI